MNQFTVQVAIASTLSKTAKVMQLPQRYRCRNSECHRSSFIRNYSYRGYLSEVKQQIGDMAINGSGIRDTARVLKISPTTVIEELKKTKLACTGQHTTA